MKKHECNKEVELQAIKDDLGYIKKTLAGNGEKGLQKTVELIQETIANIQMTLIKLQSYNHLKNWILGGSVTSLVGICAFLFGKIFGV